MREGREYLSPSEGRSERSRSKESDQLRSRPSSKGSDRESSSFGEEQREGSKQGQDQSMPSAKRQFQYTKMITDHDSGVITTTTVQGDIPKINRQMSEYAKETFISALGKDKNKLVTHNEEENRSITRTFAGFSDKLDGKAIFGALKSILGIDKEKVYTHVDNHQNKHTASSSKLSAMPDRDRVKFFRTHTDVPATFAASELDGGVPKFFADAVKTSHKHSTDYVDIGRSIGWDHGIETSVIELYYGGEIGSHMRPKASAEIDPNKKVVKLEHE